jgi:hypothetical protein
MPKIALITPPTKKEVVKAIIAIAVKRLVDWRLRNDPFFADATATEDTSIC